MSIGDDYWIANDRGEKVFKVDGKALRIPQTLIFGDRSGRELARIQECMQSTPAFISIRLERHSGTSQLLTGSIIHRTLFKPPLFHRLV